MNGDTRTFSSPETKISPSELLKIWLYARKGALTISPTRRDRELLLEILT